MAFAAMGLVGAMGVEQPQQPFAIEAVAPSKRVDVGIGVMSKCPDALYFENVFSRTLEKVNEKIKLSLHFIASRNDSSSLGATCKHGKEECLGNIHQLCVIDALKPKKAGKRFDLGPSAAQRLWWDFVQCENFEGGLKRIGEESLAKQCIQAIGGTPHWENDGLRDCVDGPKGRRLLEASIKDVKKRGIVNSATLQIEGETVCIRDDGQWKHCTAGHEPRDWVELIEDAYRRKNPSEAAGFVTPGRLYKRQNPAPTNNGTTSSPAPSPTPQGNDNGQQGAPLSVFAVAEWLLALLCGRIGPAQMQLPIAAGSNSVLSLQPRQSDGGGGSGGGGNGTITNTNSAFFTGPSFPTPYLAFGIAAIALFVLVVSFVLLRIFVRNRRLRRLGIYPDGPIDRLLGGTVREYEDTLAPPRLWEAKIADVRAGGVGADARAEKSALGGGVGAGDVKQHGWDALMPVAAALPPNLYPVIYEASEQTNTTTLDVPPSYPPQPSHQHATRIGRHMPQFLRRQTGDASEAAGVATGATAPVSSTLAVPGSGGVGSDPSSAVASANGDRGEERMAASVNVTVLIAMPSPRTIFPSNRRLGSTASNPSLRNPRHSALPAGGKLEEVDEGLGDGDQDGSSLKGKARRAPSFRSVKSATSVQSLAEARREAFFNQVQRDEEGETIEPAPGAVTATVPLPAYGEEEEEELPELMFGTASVPIFSQVSPADGVSKTATTAGGKLTQPTRSEILSLVASASKAREKKVEVEAAAAEKMRKQEEGEMDVTRRSNADTSMDGDGVRSIDDVPQTPMGNVTTRMMQANNVGAQSYEMDNMGPSRDRSGASRSMEVQTPNTLDPLVYAAAPIGSSASHHGTVEQSRSNLTLDIPSSPSAHTAHEGTLTPTNSILPPSSDSRRFSISSWHTGLDEDGNAARAIAAQPVDVDVPARP